MVVLAKIQAVLHGFAQLGVKMGIGGHDIAGDMIGAVRRGGVAAGFPHDQKASAIIPLLQAQFPKSIVAAGGDPGEIERGGAEAADAGDLRHQAAQGAGEGEAALGGDGCERDAGGEDRILEITARTRSQVCLNFSGLAEY